MTDEEFFAKVVTIVTTCMGLGSLFISWAYLRPLAAIGICLIVTMITFFVSAFISGFLMAIIKED